MKRIAALIFILLLFCLASFPASAKTAVPKGDASPAETEKENLREGLLAILPDPAKEVLPDPTDKDALDEALGFRAVFSLFAEGLASEGSLLSGRLLLLLALTLFFGAAALFTRGSASGIFMQSASALALFSLLWGTADRVFSFFADLSKLALGLSPLYVSLLAAGGGTASAGTAGAGFAAFLSVLELFSTTVFPPLLRMLFALALLSALGNHTLIRELSRRLSGVAILLFSVLSMLLLASLSFQGSLASSADSVAIRTVKYTASSAIPLVGGTVSGALGALHASLSLLKSTLGGTAVIALLFLLLPPLLEVFLLRVALSFCESIAAFTEAGALGETISRFRSIMDMTLAALVTVSILFLLTVGICTGLSPFGG